MRLRAVGWLAIGFLVSGFVAVSPAPAFAATTASAAFTGGAGTVTVAGTLYAKEGAALTLTVQTTDAHCVMVTGPGRLWGATASAYASPTWYFYFTADPGNGLQTVTITAYEQWDSPGSFPIRCSGNTATTTASVFYDNSSPVVTGLVSPPQNVAGWNNSDVNITWSATDAGSGVATGPTPSTDSVTGNTAGVTKTATATDRLGNSGTGSVTVKLDKNAPTITGSRSPAANAYGWNNTDVIVSFNCSDPLSGIKSCSGPATLSNSGVYPSFTGVAVDNADNSANATVSGINIDKVAPTLSGTPTTSPNAAGWYNGNVTVQWAASDGLSGIATAPPDSTISGEGTGLTASTSVSDKAGNSTNGTSYPVVKIDRTAPNTTATAPANWNNTDVTVSLNANDALSGIHGTYYILDGSGTQAGSSVAISSEGDHMLQFWSVDRAGNIEATKSVHVKIDKSPPTINHTLSPAANANGWNNTDVTVTFICGDALSGVASCTDPQTVTTEGQNQAVTGTATDAAGNAATDPATVSIDRTAPEISATAHRAANGNGWYNADVTVSFTCGDALSGVASCPASQTLGAGTNQSANGTATDAAGNTASAGVGGINVDMTGPTLSGAATTAPNGNGWYSGDVPIRWACSDALSGIDGGCPADSVITGEGDNLSASATVSDLAGNSANATVSGIKIDRTPPSTLVTVPDPLPTGWYASDVLVTLTTGGDLSGVATTYYSIDDGAAQEYTAPFNHALGGIHTITFWSVDNAGNVEDVTSPGHSITLKIDDVPPTITGSRTPGANSFGWNNSEVVANFSCSDAESGIATCSDPVTVAGEGGGQSVTGHAKDSAGNEASATVDDINIDLTAPAVGLVGGPANGQRYGFGSVPDAPTCSASDALSGLDGTCSVSGYSTAPGSHTIAASATDKAGNAGSASVTYTVEWAWTGFFQPIENPTSAVPWNLAKAGQSIPVKFNLGGDQGLDVLRDGFPKIFGKACPSSSTQTDPIEEYVTTTGGGSVLTYDALAQQYMYVWKTDKAWAGKCFTFDLGLRDDSSHVFWVQFTK